MSVTHCNYNYGLQTPPQDIVCAGAPKVGYGVCAVSNSFADNLVLISKPLVG